VSRDLDRLVLRLMLVFSEVPLELGRAGSFHDLGRPLFLFSELYV